MFINRPSTVAVAAKEESVTSTFGVVAIVSAEPSLGAQPESPTVEAVVI